MILTLGIGRTATADGPNLPTITILSPTCKADEIELRPKTEVPCRVRVEFKEAGHDEGIVMANLYAGNVMAGSFILKPTRVDEKTFEYEGKILMPSNGKYVLKALRYEKDLEREPSREIKSRPGRRDPSEVGIVVKQAR